MTPVAEPESVAFAELPFISPKDDGQSFNPDAVMCRVRPDKGTFVNGERIPAPIQRVRVRFPLVIADYRRNRSPYVGTVPLPDARIKSARSED